MLRLISVSNELNDHIPNQKRLVVQAIIRGDTNDTPTSISTFLILKVFVSDCVGAVIVRVKEDKPLVLLQEPCLSHTVIIFQELLLPVLYPDPENTRMHRFIHFLNIYTKILQL